MYLDTILDRGDYGESFSRFVPRRSAFVSCNLPTQRACAVHDVFGSPLRLCHSNQPQSSDSLITAVPDQTEANQRRRLFFYIAWSAFFDHDELSWLFNIYFLLVP